MADFDIVEGWTEKLLFTLEGITSIPVGATVSLVLKRKDGSTVTTTGKTAVESAANRQVSYTPDAADLVASLSPYTAHWSVDSAGEVAFFPQGAADRWLVHPQ